jgi:hypothetical protein
MLVIYFGWPLSAVIFSVYGLCCIMSILFAFFMEGYREIEERLNFSLFSAPTFNPLDIDMNFIDSWAKQHNKEVGVFLIMLSIFNVVSVISLLKA